MTTIPFSRDMTVDYGAVTRMSPLIRRVVARNPSAFTFHGTGTYIVGHGNVAIIDPGPLRPDHVDALLDAVRGEQVSHIIITHTHIDHSPAARLVQERTGAATYGYGPHGGDRGGPKVEEGGDHDFRPDQVIGDGDVIAGQGWNLEAVHTPGHTSNHLCFALREEAALLSGDHVMGWSTSVISPPDGDMRAYLASLAKLLGRDEQRYYPTHGLPIEAPKPFVEAFIRHRRDREAQILAGLKEGPKTIPALVQVMYADVPAHLHPAAGRSVLAHLIALAEDGRVRADGPVDEGAIYALP